MENAITLLSLEHPVFATYVIAAALMVLKVMGQGWMTAYRMQKTNSGLVSPEDIQRGLLNRAPDPAQLEIHDYDDRSRGIHQNDLENILAFWVAGFLFIMVDPALWVAQALMYGFVADRIAHFLAYATRQTHEVRATFYTIGSLIVIYMTLHVLWIAIA